MTEDKDARIAESAIERYKRFTEGDQIDDPVEALRFFCSLSMKTSQDWIDIEQFFDLVIEQRTNIERKLAEQQSYICRLRGVIDLCHIALVDGCVSDRKAAITTINSPYPEHSSAELNNLLAKAKEEGRKEALSAVTDNSILVRNDRGDVGAIYLSDFRLAVQTDVMRDVRNGILGMRNEVFELLDEISAKQLAKAKESAAPKPQGETK